MTDYLSVDQYEQLLRPINPARVGTDGKGYSHVEAYEIRAHLIRIFGPARWSAEVIDQQMIYETSEERKNKKGDTYTAWTVCYRSILRLTVCAPSGTPLATYTEGATGEATNQPGRGDAHELALKTSESQALKRAAFNLGDQFGLSLFNKGSKQALVKGSLRPVVGATVNGEPVGETAAPVDSHITEQLPPEDTQVEDKRETNPPKAVPPAPDTTERDTQVEAWRDKLLAGPGDKAAPPFYAAMHLEASKAGILTALVGNRDGEIVSVGAFLESERKRQRTAA